MRAYASASGGVMFVPDELERTLPKVLKRSSNDNADEEVQSEKDRRDERTPAGVFRVSVEFFMFYLFWRSGF